MNYIRKALILNFQTVVIDNLWGIISHFFSRFDYFGHLISKKVLLFESVVLIKNYLSTWIVIVHYNDRFVSI